MKKILSTLLLFTILSMFAPAFAEATEGVPGSISGRSVTAGLLSLLIWPGIGQVINDNPVDKNVTHAVLGLTGVFRLWSFYDGLVDRRGGVWHDRI